MRDNKNKITKTDFHLQCKEDPSFIDFLIDCVFVDVTTVTAGKTLGVSEKWIQILRNKGELDVRKMNGYKRRYVYWFPQLIMKKWYNLKKKEK